MYIRVIVARQPHRAPQQRPFAAALTAAQEAEVNALLLETVVDRLAVPGATVIAATPDEEVEPLSDRFGDRARVVAQGTGTDGERLRRVASAVWVEYELPMVVLGARAPDMPTGRVDEAVTALVDVDAVLGPGASGRCYLLAVVRPIGNLLRAVEWGARAAAERVRAVARGEGFRMRELATCPTVDTLEELRALVRRLDQAEEPLLQRLHERLVAAKLPI